MKPCRYPVNQAYTIFIVLTVITFKVADKNFCILNTDITFSCLFEDGMLGIATRLQVSNQTSQFVCIE